MDGFNFISDEEMMRLILQDNKLKKIIEDNNFTFKFGTWDWEEQKRIISKYFLSEKNICINNFDISKCKQKIKGLRFVIKIKYNKMYLASTKCTCCLIKKISSNYLFYDFSHNILELNFSNADYWTGIKCRTDIIASFASYFKPEPPHKGIYIYGPPGVGKTYSLMLLANKLASKGKKVVFVSSPTLIAKTRADFNLEKEDKVGLESLCLKADVLFLDDIGNEMVTTWVRDNVLFHILNYRLSHNKITFFSSNYNIRQLEEIYANVKITSSNTQHLEKSIEETKSKRLVRRISDLAKAELLNEL